MEQPQQADTVPKSATTASASALTWRALLSLLYLTIAAAITALVSRFVQEGGASGGEGGADKKTAVRNLVSSPSDAPTLADVGGHETVKAELTAAVLTPMRHPRLFYDGPRALRPPRGILLHGPPGTGKTLLARAVANEARVPLLTVTAADLESKWWGETPKLLQAMFDAARKTYAPCLIFFDEIDGLGRARSEQDQACVYSLKCELLRHLDGLEGAAVTVLACTNCPHSLDPALRRRFQRVLRVGRPGADDRLGVLRVLARDETDDGQLLPEVAARTEGCTGADLAALYEEASSRRLRAGTTGADLDALSDGAALLARLGPLTREHWETAARQSGRPMAARVEEKPPSSAAATTGA